MKYTATLEEGEGGEFTASIAALARYADADGQPVAK